MKNKKAPKNISILITSLEGGGAERVLTNLANEFASRNYQVEFALFKKKGVFINQVSKKVSIVPLELNIKFGKLISFFKYLRNKKPDIVISSLEVNNLIAIISKLLSFSKSKLIIRVENPLSVPNRSKPKKFIERLLLSILYRFADEIIAVSNGVADDLAKFAFINRKRISVIYNPIINADLLNKKTEANQDTRFSSDPSPLILGIGRLTQSKNFSNLIQAFAIIIKQRPARLIILGEGEQRRDLEKLIKQLNLEEFAKLPGFVDNPYAYLMNADVFALSSNWEGLPTVLIEALACGTKVVSTDCNYGPREILKNGEYGIIVPVNDPQLLAEAVLKTLEEKFERSIPADWLEQFTARYCAIKISDLF